jgi:ubiquinone/menaquinone biosynthesis C-methylase UbiE
VDGVWRNMDAGVLGRGHRSCGLGDQEADITAIDFSEEMLRRAKEKARQQKVKVRLQQMHVQSLEFPDDTFDTVVASFVFRSVPNPVRGLMEVERVCRLGAGWPCWSMS